MKKTLYILVGLGVLLASQAVAAPQVVDRIVGVVNGEIITLYELNDRMKPVYEKIGDKVLSAEEKEQLQQLRHQILNQMINDILLVQTAEQLGVNVDEEEVERYIDSVKEERGWSEEEYLDYVKERGITLQAAYDRVRNDLLRHKLLSTMVYKQIVVTQKDVREYFDEHASQFETGRIVRLRLLYMDSIDELGPVRDRIESGEMTFEEAAANFSKGPGADQGGDLGQMAWEDLAQDWRDALEGLEPGEVSRPFPVQDGVAVLSIVSEGDGTEMAFEEVKEGIYNQLMSKRKEEVLREYVKGLRDKAVIDDRL